MYMFTWLSCSCRELTLSSRALCSWWYFLRVSCWLSFCFSRSWEKHTHKCTWKVSCGENVWMKNPSKASAGSWPSTIQQPSMNCSTYMNDLIPIRRRLRGCVHRQLQGKKNKKHQFSGRKSTVPTVIQSETSWVPNTTNIVHFLIRCQKAIFKAVFSCVTEC